MTRLDELDRVPFLAGRKDAVIAFARWACTQLPRQSKARLAILDFLRSRLGLTGRMCRECQKWKQPEEMNGPNSGQCKSCRNAYRRRLRASNPKFREAARLAQQRWTATHRERRREISRESAKRRRAERKELAKQPICG
jgi:hypothetical protein